MKEQLSTPLFPPASDYVPFKDGWFRLAMGLFPLDLQDWIEPDECMAAELGEKERLLSKHHPEVFAALPEAMEGSAEVLQLLIAYLPAQFPTLYQRIGGQLHNLVTAQSWNLSRSVLHPLDLAGRLVQEDLCLMARNRAIDIYRLVGASVCFPARWRLAEKMGKPLNTIHAPIPGYEEQLASTMDRFFARLKIDRPVWRLNWGLVDDPALFQPSGHGQDGHNPSITAQNAGEKLWLRMERQTLRRLPHTQNILFTIRVYIRPLEQLAAHPERAAALAAALRALPDSMRLYKSLLPILDATLAWLDRAATPGQG